MNKYDYSERVAVITGGCNGIGAAITERLVHSGAKVAIWDMDTHSVEARVSALSPESVRLIQTDVSDLASVVAATAATETAFGGIDILSKIPRERFVSVDEITSMVLWMASAENSFTTGAAFDLSGGRATY